MLPIGIGIALAIRIGTILSVNVRRAKLLAVACLVFSIVVFGVMSVVLYNQREWIVGLFTVEEDVLEGCE
jgi:Na+-driven multidrug efflux pump